MKSVLLVALAVVASGAGVAHADQCQLVDSGTALRAFQLLGDHPYVLSYCEPCGDRVPGRIDRVAAVATERDRSGTYQVVMNEHEIDLAYTFVQTGPDEFENLAKLASCPTSGVSGKLAVHNPWTDARVTPPRAEPTATTTYVIEQHASIGLTTLLGTCLATSGLCSLGLLMMLRRRRRLAMEPRALRLVDRH